MRYFLDLVVWLRAVKLTLNLMSWGVKFVKYLAKAMNRRPDWNIEKWQSFYRKKELSNETMDKILALLEQEASEEPMADKHTVNFDTDPRILDGWQVVEHRKVGRRLRLDSVKLTLFQSLGQTEGGAISGEILRKELIDKSVLNASFLDYWLVHPSLVPEEFKGKYIFFWGTIYRDYNGDLYVRYLFWDRRWCWGNFQLNDFCDRDCYAILLGER